MTALSVLYMATLGRKILPIMILILMKSPKWTIPR